MIDFNRRITEGGTLVFKTSGKLDQPANQYLFECVQDEIEAGNKNVVLNFSDLGHVGSITLGSLVAASNRVAKTGGNIYLAGVQNQVLDIFRMMKLDALFNFFDTEEEAIVAIEADAKTDSEAE